MTERLPWRGAPAPDPVDGIPAYLQEPLLDWITEFPRSDWERKRLLQRLALRFRDRFPISPSGDGTVGWMQLSRLPTKDADMALWAIDWLLSTLGPGGSGAFQYGPSEDEAHTRLLAAHLNEGGSAWAVVFDGASHAHVLERRTPPEAAEMAGSAEGVPGDLLRKAWADAFGMHPSPADACVDSIRAVEGALKPLVVPSDAAANLGSVIGELKANKSKWRCALTGRSGKVLRPAPDTLQLMIDAIDALWPGPDRHPDGSPLEAVSTEEGRAAAMTAAWVICVAQQGGLTRV